MCLIGFVHQAHPHYPLILVANRDEFYARPTQSLHHWDNGILAGKDRQMGGTWLGVHPEQQRWAAVTNYRDPNLKQDRPQSRGALVTHALLSQKSIPNYLHHLLTQVEDYAPFNLLVGDFKQAYYLSSVQQAVQIIVPGAHVLSNAHLDTPWPKVERLKTTLGRLNTRQPGWQDQLWQSLRNDQCASDAELPQTGVPIEWERAVSATHIETSDYGTRSSALITLNHAGCLVFREQSFDAQALVHQKRISLMMSGQVAD